jgi:hypothetical protein
MCGTEKRNMLTFDMHRYEEQQNYSEEDKQKFKKNKEMLTPESA